MNNDNILRELSALTDIQRLEARQRALDVVIRSHGERPSPEQLTRDDITEYPAWLNKIVLSLLIVVGISAFATSFFRLFTIGRDNFLMTINDHWQGVIVVVAVVLMAEFLTMVSGLSREILLPYGKRWIMFFPMLLGVVIALVGNWTVASPHDLFSVLEAVSPPIVVLIVAMLGERLIIQTVKQRHELRRQYQRAINDWKRITANPDKSPMFRNAYANALRETIIDTNSKGAGSTRRKELMSALDRHSWSVLVQREIQSEQWFTDEPLIVPAVTVSAAVNPENPIQPLPAIINTGNGHSNGKNVNPV
jgi:hypothetical protein